MNFGIRGWVWIGLVNGGDYEGGEVLGIWNWELGVGSWVRWRWSWWVGFSWVVCFEFKWSFIEYL